MQVLSKLTVFLILLFSAGKIPMASGSELIFTSEKFIRTAMVSQHPRRLCNFYGKYGVRFRRVWLHKQYHYISSNTSLTIIPSDIQTLGGFVTYSIPSTLSTEEQAYYKFEDDLFYGNFPISSSELGNFLLNKPISLVSIVRYPDLEKARTFYQGLGEWLQEKHGNGPLHYSLVNASNVFELYPCRKGTNSYSLEHILIGGPSSGDRSFELDPDGRRIQFMDKF